MFQYKFVKDAATGSQYGMDKEESAASWPEGEALFDDIMEVLMGNCLAKVDTCGGPNSEGARDAAALLKGSLVDGIAAHQGEIMTELGLMIESADGNIDQFYRQDKRLLRVLKALFPWEVLQ